MRRNIVMPGVLMAVLIVIGAIAVGGASPRATLRSITVMERSEQVSILPPGAPKFGSSLVFNARLTTLGGKTVGQLRGSGAFATDSTVVASAVYALHDGQIDVILSAAPGYQRATAAVVGGTGHYTNAHGTVTSVANRDGTFTDTFRLTASG